MPLTSEEQDLLLNLEDLQNFQPTQRTYICGSCSSALDVAHYLAKEEQLDPWDSVLAVHQWAGRGQLRRTWVSAPGNLFAAWRLPMPLPQWQGLLSVLLGWVACTVMGELKFDLRLKWPNDLLAHGRKVGGILIEERGDVLLVGIGLNLASCPGEEELRVDRACTAGTLGGDPRKMSILALWLRLVHLGRLRYTTILSSTTPLEFSQSLRPMLAYLGKTVLIRDDQSFVRGVFSGVGADGGLLVLVNGQLQTLFSGSLICEE